MKFSCFCLTYIFGFPCFDHDAFLHHALHVLGAHWAGEGLSPLGVWSTNVDPGKHNVKVGWSWLRTHWISTPPSSLWCGHSEFMNYSGSRLTNQRARVVGLGTKWARASLAWDKCILTRNCLSYCRLLWFSQLAVNTSTVVGIWTCNPGFARTCELF